jgi:hypothetical protein
MKTLITFLLVVSIIAATIPNVKASESQPNSNSAMQLMGAGSALFVLFFAGLGVATVCGLYQMAKYLTPTNDRKHLTNSNF